MGTTRRYTAAECIAKIEELEGERETVSLMPGVSTVRGTTLDVTRTRDAIELELATWRARLRYARARTARTRIGR